MWTLPTVGSLHYTEPFCVQNVAVVKQGTTVPFIAIDKETFTTHEKNDVGFWGDANANFNIMCDIDGTKGETGKLPVLYVFMYHKKLPFPKTEFLNENQVPSLD